MEELKHKYREYYWEYGKSPFQEEVENINNNNQNNANNHIKGENGDSHVPENGNGLNGIAHNSRCGVHGCKSKAMALTRFCQMHILSDAKQKLYKACNYSIKRFDFQFWVYAFFLQLSLLYGLSCLMNYVLELDRYFLA